MRKELSELAEQHSLICGKAMAEQSVNQHVNDQWVKASWSVMQVQRIYSGANFSNFRMQFANEEHW
jgi:hypothetical protein